MISEINNSILKNLNESVNSKLNEDSKTVDNNLGINDTLLNDVYEGWTGKDFIEELKDQFDIEWKGIDNIDEWCVYNQPYYKKRIPAVIKFFNIRQGLLNKNDLESVERQDELLANLKKVKNTSDKNNDSLNIEPWHKFQSNNNLTTVIYETDKELYEKAIATKYNIDSTNTVLEVTELVKDNTSNDEANEIITIFENRLLSNFTKYFTKWSNGSLETITVKIANNNEVIAEKEFNVTNVNESVNSKLNEGAGAGYTVKGTIDYTTIKINNYNVVSTSEPDKYGEVVAEIDCDIDVGLTDVSAESYYYGGEIEGDPIPAKITHLSLNVQRIYSEETEDYELGEIDEGNIEDSLNDLTVYPVIGGGWSHLTFNGDLSCDYNEMDMNIYSDLTVQAIDMVITNQDVIGIIDDLVRGENNSQYTVRDVDGDILEEFDDEDEAIEWAKANNGYYVEIEYYNLRPYFGGDSVDFNYDYYDSETVWTREDEDMEESALTEARRNPEVNTMNKGRDAKAIYGDSKRDKFRGVEQANRNFWKYDLVTNNMRSRGTWEEPVNKTSNEYKSNKRMIKMNKELIDRPDAKDFPELTQGFKDNNTRLENRNKELVANKNKRKAERLAKKNESALNESTSYSDLKIAGNNLWGEDEIIKPTKVKGIYDCSTARHGGYLVDTDIHPELKEFGWSTNVDNIVGFEEDCEALKVLWVYPEINNYYDNKVDSIREQINHYCDDSKAFFEKFPNYGNTTNESALNEKADTYYTISLHGPSGKDTYDTANTYKEAKEKLAKGKEEYPDCRFTITKMKR